MEVSLSPGYGHDFHKHPDQEEVIGYVIEGSVEQWLEDTADVLTHGDSVFIPADMVHASFNVSSQSAKSICYNRLAQSPSKGTERERQRCYGMFPDHGTVENTPTKKRLFTL